MEPPYLSPHLQGPHSEPKTNHVRQRTKAPLFDIFDRSGWHTKHRAHLVTKSIGTSFMVESRFGETTSFLIMSSKKGTPAPQNTMFGRNLDMHQQSSDNLAQETWVLAPACVPLNRQPTGLPQVIDTPDSLSINFTAGPPVDLVSNIL